MHILQKTLYQLLLKIPKGKVSTYKQMAILLGDKNLARSVGKWLHINENPDSIPCYKIVQNNGKIGGFALGNDKKIQRLEKDGIPVKNNTITNLHLYLWKP